MQQPSAAYLNLDHHHRTQVQFESGMLLPVHILEDANLTYQKVDFDCTQSLCMYARRQHGLS